MEPGSGQVLVIGIFGGSDRLEQLPLPVHQLRQVLVPVVSEVGKSGSAGDQSRIEREFGGMGIAALLQIQEAAAFDFAGPATAGLDERRLAFRWNLQTVSDGIDQPPNVPG